MTEAEAKSQIRRELIEIRKAGASEAQLQRWVETGEKPQQKQQKQQKAKPKRTQWSGAKIQALNVRAAKSRAIPGAPIPWDSAASHYHRVQKRNRRAMGGLKRRMNKAGYKLTQKDLYKDYTPPTEGDEWANQRQAAEIALADWPTLPSMCLFSNRSSERMA